MACPQNAISSRIQASIAYRNRKSRARFCDRGAATCRWWTRGCEILDLRSATTRACWRLKSAGLWLEKFEDRAIEGCLPVWLWTIHHYIYIYIIIYPYIYIYSIRIIYTFFVTLSDGFWISGSDRGCTCPERRCPHWGSLWNPYGTLMEPLWNPYGTLMEPLWNPYGTLMEPLEYDNMGGWNGGTEFMEFIGIPYWNHCCWWSKMSNIYRNSWLSCWESTFLW